MQRYKKIRIIVQFNTKILIFIYKSDMNQFFKNKKVHKK